MTNVLKLVGDIYICRREAILLNRRYRSLDDETFLLQNFLDVLIQRARVSISDTGGDIAVEAGEI